MNNQRFADAANRRCVILVPERQGMVADRIEKYAISQGMEIVETIMGARAIERLLYYIKKNSIQTVLVRQAFDISTDEKQLKKIMRIAADHNVSINAEERNYYPIVVEHWDGGDGC